MNAQTRILVVEDDPEIGRMLKGLLATQGMAVTLAPDGRAMFQALARGPVDLVLLDLMLPGEGGLTLCGRLRATSEIPVVMLTAKGEDIDRIVGLEMGADDYIAKPFHSRELLARLRAVLRRSAAARGARAVGGRYGFDGWLVDTAQRHVHAPDGARVMLTGAEFDLLVVFCEHPRRVLTRERLIDLTHGRVEGPFDRSIDVLVSRLRQKLETTPRDPMLIKTIRTAGYLFAPEVAAG